MGKKNKKKPLSALTTPLIIHRTLSVSLQQALQQNNRFKRLKKQAIVLKSYKDLLIAIS